MADFFCPTLGTVVDVVVVVTLGTVAVVVVVVVTLGTVVDVVVVVGVGDVGVVVVVVVVVVDSGEDPVLKPVIVPTALLCKLELFQNLTV